MKNKGILTLLMAAALLFAAETIFAGPIIDVTIPTSLQVSQGQIASFYGTLTNVSGTVYLNGADLNLNYEMALLNPDGVLSNWPQSVGESEIGFYGLLFTVTVPLDTPVGFYSGVYNLFGGADGSAQGQLFQHEFTLNVVQAVPEPALILLLGLGIGAVSLGAWRFKA